MTVRLAARADPELGIAPLPELNLKAAVLPVLRVCLPATAATLVRSIISPLAATSGLRRCQDPMRGAGA